MEPVDPALRIGANEDYHLLLDKIPLTWDDSFEYAKFFDLVSLDWVEVTIISKED